MPTTPFISIVTNLYRSKKFLPKLIKSVANQTFEDWELICVDDCSPTDDATVAKRLAHKYGIEDRVVIIRNETNLGLSRAKERGIKEARGKYITFIDGDDWLEPDALKHLAMPAMTHDVDLVTINVYRVHPILGKSRIYSGLPPEDTNRVLSQQELFDKCIVNFLGPAFFTYAYWAKLYRAQVLKHTDYVFPDKDHVIGEDRWFNLEVFQHLKSGYFSDYCGYNWLAGGLTNMRSSSQWNYRKTLEDEYRHYDSNKQLIDKYDYHKADVALACVLDYEFKCAVIELFRTGASRDEVLKFIDDNISMRYYQDFNLLLDYEPYQFDRPLIEAVIAHDTDKVYEILYRLHRKSLPGRVLRFIEDLFIMPFRN